MKRGAICALVLFVLGTSADALNPNLDLSQYAHTAWSNRDGFAKAAIYAIAQSPDGYLWLGTQNGLLRFDGLKRTPWQPPRGQLPSDFVSSVLFARDGTLWIGTYKGLASSKGGAFTRYPELEGLFINSLLEDREGTLWVGGFAYTPPGKLCAIRGSKVQCYGQDGSLGNGVLGVYEDRKRNLWAGTRTGVWHWRPGSPQFYPIAGESYGIQGMAEDDDGGLLIALTGRLGRLMDGRLETAYVYPAGPRRSYTGRMLRDRDGGLWVGTSNGIVHIHQGRADALSQQGGPSGDAIPALFEDREGSVWAASLGGLDRFRDYAVTTYGAQEGLANVAAGSLLVAKDGTLLVHTNEGLTEWKNGAVRHIAGNSLTRGGLFSMFQDDEGRIWVAGFGGVGYLDNGRFTSLSGFPASLVYSIAEDTERHLWLANLDYGLLEIQGLRMVRQLPWARLGHKDHALSLAADPVQGGLWLGFFGGGLAYFKDGRVLAKYGSNDGLGRGPINDLYFDQHGALWAATEGGLSKIQGGRFTTITSRNGLPCDGVLWAREDNDGSFWLSTACGVVRITRPEMNKWTEDPERAVQATVFDASDGVWENSVHSTSPNVGKAPDGKLSFTTLNGISTIDPRHIPFNKLPPPVQIEQVIAGRKTYDATFSQHLPPLVSDVEIDYTALSLVVPEKNRFKYKLEGYDGDWIDAGNRRQAFYTKLPPRAYTFRVKASNNSGVWNEAGASFNFSIDPAYYQTNWFRTSLAAVFLAIVLGLYELRLHQLAREFNMRLEERVEERTRIARELHDSLLQSFHGLLPRLQAACKLLPGRAGDARQVLEAALDDAAQAVTQAREAVQDLRAATVVTNDLAKAIEAVGEELAADQGSGSGEAAAFSMEVEGTPRDLHPILRDDIYRIVVEAVRNAFRHARARRIEVEIIYESKQLRVRIRDDGIGIDASVLKQGRPAHFGLTGMRERARRIGGQLEVWSAASLSKPGRLSTAGAGTEVELIIPAAIVYRNHRGRGFRLFRNKVSTNS